MPQTRSSAFRFQAKLDGTYSLVIYETPGRTGTDYYSLKYTVYTARVS
jgi:hypothetical protein